MVFVFLSCYPWVPVWVIWSLVLFFRRYHPVKAIIMPPVYAVVGLIIFVVSLIGAMAFTEMFRSVFPRR